MTKKCSVCGREMAEHECGDEFPEERVCDQCAGITPDVIVALDKAHEALCDAQRLLGWNTPEALEVGKVRNATCKLAESFTQEV